MKEQDLRIQRLEEMFTFMIHPLAILDSLLISFFRHYGSELANIYFGDPIIDLFWAGIKKEKVQIPSNEIIMRLLSGEELLLNKKNVPISYIAIVYYELKSNGYKISWKQASTIASYTYNL
ncbi:kinase-like domain-containing protein [Rhizophagus clarus]|nr:kinase-like domain-containing protein [Rhizophagus clarus]